VQDPYCLRCQRSSGTDFIKKWDDLRGFAASAHSLLSTLIEFRIHLRIQSPDIHLRIQSPDR
jgi:hypothetical protein